MPIFWEKRVEISIRPIMKLRRKFESKRAIKSGNVAMICKVRASFKEFLEAGFKRRNVAEMYYIFIVVFKATVTIFLI